MAYSASYAFSSQAVANNGDWIWDTDSTGGADHTVQVENTDGYWCWTDTGSTSSSTGPPSGTACVYPETSSPVALGDSFEMYLATAEEVDASLYALMVEFTYNVQGNTTNHLYFDAWDGTQWNQIDSFPGDAVTTMVDSDVYDFGPDGENYTNDDFNIRFRVALDGSGNAYHTDFAISTVDIYGEDSTVKGAGMMLASAQFVKTTAGAEDPGTFDFDESLPWGGITLALRKAAAESTLEMDFDGVNIPGTNRVSNENTGSPLTINKTGSGQLIASDPGTGDGETNIVASNTFTFTVSPAITNFEWRLYEVDALGSLEGSVELDGEESSSTSSNDYTYNSASDIIVALQIISQPDEDYVSSVTYYTLSNADQSVTINLVKDDNN